MLSDVPFCFSFRMSSCHTLSKCFKNWDTFDDLHYILYKKKNKTLRSLPPTSNMSHGHVLKSHYVILSYLNLILAPDTNLNPVEFDWNSLDSVLTPNKYIVTLPEMYNITCGCKKKCAGRCQCRKFRASYREFSKCNKRRR